MVHDMAVLYNPPPLSTLPLRKELVGLLSVRYRSASYLRGQRRPRRLCGPVEHEHKVRDVRWADGGDRGVGGRHLGLREADRAEEQASELV